MASSTLPSIYIIGSLNTDLVTHTPRVPGPGETITANSFSTGAGGKGANQAVACVRLSRSSAQDENPLASVKMIGCVGDDEFGGILKKGMAADGMDVEGVEVREGISSGVAVILVEPTGENRILVTPGANGLYKASPQHLDPTPSLLIMQLEIPIPEVLELLRLASGTSPPTKTMLNPAPAVDLPESTYKLVSHLIVNESEASMLSGRKLDTTSTSLKLECLDVVDFFRSRGVSDSIIITLGGQGAFWCDVKRSAHGLEAAAKVKVVDTTAAGDTFVGGYAVSIVSGASVEDAVKWASKAGALTVTRKGAQEAIPWRSEI